ncbi:MAG: aldehyde dehydrogenase family protein [Acidimicrobiia bacterium]|nr:aldehyde dehydrogenase family protein [Acidimicrobiia bacterium]
MAALTDAPATGAAIEIQGLIARARRAQTAIESFDQRQVDDLIRAMVWAVCQPGVAGRIARLAVDETRLGNYESKLAKMANKTRAALADIIHDRSVGVIHVDEARQIIEIAKPVGVIGALSTSTHPEATPVVKAINAVKGRNAIIVAPHPRAKGTNKVVCDLMRAAIEKMGAPADLVIAIEEPTLELTTELMRQCDRILATGGAPMVRAAYSSGTPALGVGVGNAVITVDDTANLADAAEKIRISKTFDEATSCSSDNAVIAFRGIREPLLDELRKQGGWVASPDEAARIAAVLWQDGALNRDLICRPALPIAQAARIDVPAGTTFIVVPQDGVGPDHPLSGEKLSIVMAFYTVDTLQQAIDLTNRIQQYQGLGHSCGLYTTSDEHILAFALGTRTSRVMVNQPQSLSNSGALWNGMYQTFSLGCGSWGRNSTTNNITWRDLINVTRVSKPLPVAKTIPPNEELFGDVMEKLR